MGRIATVGEFSGYGLQSIRDGLRVVRDRLILENNLRTQAEVDRFIQRTIDKAVALEELRDAEEFESPGYWRLHDLAIELHSQAESLMPGL